MRGLLRSTVLASLAVLACGPSRIPRPAKVAAPTLPPADPTAVREFNSAMRAVKLGGPEAYLKASERLTRAVAIDKKMWEGWHNLGAVRFALGNDAGAVEAY